MTVDVHDVEDHQMDRAVPCEAAGAPRVDHAHPALEQAEVGPPGWVEDHDFTVQDHTASA